MSLVFQTVGGAFFLSAAQSAFVNKLITTVPFTAPTVNPMQLISTGATQIRTAFTPEELPGILIAYMDGITVTFAMAIAGTGAAFLLIAEIAHILSSGRSAHELGVDTDGGIAGRWAGCSSCAALGAAALEGRTL